MQSHPLRLTEFDDEVALLNDRKTSAIPLEPKASESGLKQSQIAFGNAGRKLITQESADEAILVIFVYCNC